MTPQVFSAVLLILAVVSAVVLIAIAKRVNVEYYTTFKHYQLSFVDYIWQVVPFKYISGFAICAVLFIWSVYHLIAH